jgi:hypothetical protein
VGSSSVKRTTRRRFRGVRLAEPIDGKALKAMVVRRSPDSIDVIVEAAVDVILETIADALAHGRGVCLRGFGRFIPRHYVDSSTKKIGLLFHPSPRLKKTLNHRCLKRLTRLHEKRRALDGASAPVSSSDDSAALPSGAAESVDGLSLGSAPAESAVDFGETTTRGASGDGELGRDRDD